MALPVVCTDEITVTGPGQLTCAGDWTAYESDVLQFAGLLDFDAGLFGLLMTSAIVLFLTGYSLGVVIRQMHRV